MDYTVENMMKIWANRYETPKFIENDPIQIPHRYDERRDIEVSAFVTAWIAFGGREQIIEKANFIDQEIFKSNPYAYIMGNVMFGANNETLNSVKGVIGREVPQWRKYKGSQGNFYRFYKYADFYELCNRLYLIYLEYDNLETALIQATSNTKTALGRLQLLFGNVKGIPDESGESACKRLCLFLRWMCRKNSPVDFGIWNICDPKNLIMPLDTHVHEQALKLQLTSRKTPDIITAIEITDKMRLIFPDDPTKGDFALFGYGVDPDKEKIKIPKKTVENMSGEELIEHPLFIEISQSEIKTMIDKYDADKKAAQEKGLELKANPFNKLRFKGYFKPKYFGETFISCINKSDIGLSAAERKVIETIGTVCAQKTIKALIEKSDETKGKNSNRKNQ